MTVPERIAMNICWLARQTALTEESKPKPIPNAGLPPALRQAIGIRHPLTCDWCDYPLEELLAMGKVNENEEEARAFKRYPAYQQRELVMKAQGAR